MIKIAILEDEKAAAKKLTTFFDRYTAEHPDVEFDITHFNDGLSLLDNYRDHYDVFLLDIQMPGINGMETAHRIREIDSEVMIIFVTNMVEYAVEGYDVRAFDFILKPVTYAAFLPKLERILRAIAIHKDAVMVKLKMKEGMQWVSSNDILYLEVSNHDVFLRLSNGTILRQPGPLSKFEKSLETVSFARNNACYLVNLKHIRGIHGDFVDIGEERLPISKSKRKEFLSQLAQYKGKSR